MDETDLVRVHEAGIAHHVAAVGQIDGEHRSAAVLNGRRAVVVELLVGVGANIAARENVFQVLGECRVDGHDVFEVPVLGAIFDHHDLAVFFDDGGLDFADLGVAQDFLRKLAVKDLLADIRHALRAKRVGGAGPTQRWLGLFVRLQERLFAPCGGKRRRLLAHADGRVRQPGCLRCERHHLLYILDRFWHRQVSPAKQKLIAGWIGRNLPGNTPAKCNK